MSVNELLGWHGMGAGRHLLFRMAGTHHQNSDPFHLARAMMHITSAPIITINVPEIITSHMWFCLVLFKRGANTLVPIVHTSRIRDLSEKWSKISLPIT